MFNPIVIAGGVGSRLWPISYEDRPKQFLQLNGYSTFQELLLNFRYSEYSNYFRPASIMCREKDLSLVEEQMKEIKYDHRMIVVEEEGIGTYSAFIVMMALTKKIANYGSGIIFPADHSFNDFDFFVEELLKQEKSGLSANSNFRLFGIKPDSMNLKYGHIIVEDDIRDINNPVKVVKSFIEKPNLSEFNNIPDENKYFWNSGIVAFNYDNINIDKNLYDENMINFIESLTIRPGDYNQNIKISSDLYKNFLVGSFDVNVLQEEKNMVVSDITNSGWRDIGSIKSFVEHCREISENNFKVGDINVISGMNNIGIVENDQKIITVGVDNILVLSRGSVTFIINIDENEIKNLETKLKYIKDNNPKYDEHDIDVIKPWGSFKVIWQNSECKIKKIFVNPGESLSYQKHLHRTEYWVVSDGVGIVKREHIDDTELFEGSLIKINPGQKHSIRNNGKVVLELIEIQTGNYLEEDDIQRFDDNYGRV